MFVRSRFLVRVPLGVDDAATFLRNNEYLACGASAIVSYEFFAGPVHLGWARLYSIAVSPSSIRSAGIPPRSLTRRLMEPVRS